MPPPQAAHPSRSRPTPSARNESSPNDGAFGMLRDFRTQISRMEIFMAFSLIAQSRWLPPNRRKGGRAKKRELWVLFSAPCVNGRKVIFMRFNHFLFILVYIASPTTLLGENVLPLVLFAGAALDGGGLCGLPIVVFRDFFRGKFVNAAWLFRKIHPRTSPALVSSCVQLNYYFSLFPTTDIYRND